MLTLDLSDFERKAREIGGAIDQVPFALANAMTTGAFKVRDALITETWPKAVTVRNRSFLRAALRVEPARKDHLTVAIVDALGRGHLGLHARGGVKKAKGRLAIPTARVAKGASGVRKGQLPRNLKRAVVKGGLIFQAEGKGKNSHLRLMYRLRPMAKIKQDVPFVADFTRYFIAEAHRAFPATMAKAMKTRR
jgi:hypothetical protein